MLIIVFIGNDEKLRSSYPTKGQFKTVNNHETNEEMLDYNTIRDHFEKEDGNQSERYIHFIDTHQEPLKTTYQAYKSTKLTNQRSHL